tara:strand:+ start:1144 stop:1281 length:138 start_codon:yes stop_codon:yes gene_type:complete
MITKNPTWNLIIENLRDAHRMKKLTHKVMSKIKELDINNEKSKDN